MIRGNKKGNYNIRQNLDRTYQVEVLLNGVFFVGFLFSVCLYYNAQVYYFGTIQDFHAIKAVNGEVFCLSFIGTLTESWHHRLCPYTFKK